jgi:hypothetical protein
VTYEQAVVQLHEFFKHNGPFRGYSYDLAKAAGIPSDMIVGVIQDTRSEKHITKHGWTIPYVGQGPGMKNPYMAVSNKDGAEKYLHPGVQHRGHDLLGALRRWGTHAEFGTTLLDPSSAEGRWEIAAHAQIKAMIAMAEVLGLNHA